MATIGGRLKCAGIRSGARLTTGVKIIPVGIERGDAEGSAHSLESGAGALEGVHFGGGGFDASGHLANGQGNEAHHHGQNCAGDHQFHEAESRQRAAGARGRLFFEG